MRETNNGVKQNETVIFMMSPDHIVKTPCFMLPYAHTIFLAGSSLNLLAKDEILFEKNSLNEEDNLRLYYEICSSGLYYKRSD